jgi:hypothetical protein
MERRYKFCLPFGGSPFFTVALAFQSIVRLTGCLLFFNLDIEFVKQSGNAGE